MGCQGSGPQSNGDGLAAGETETVRLSSFCTVFAKTEILAHLRQGVPVARIEPDDFVSKSKNSPFDGYAVRGKVLKTVVDGRIVFAADA